MFIWSGSMIHSVGSQDVGSIISLYILFRFILLMGIPGMFVGLSKELFVSEVFIISGLIV